MIQLHCKYETKGERAMEDKAKETKVEEVKETKEENKDILVLDGDFTYVEI